MKNYIDSSMSHSEYVSLIDDLLSQNRTTGPNQSESYVNYGRLNRQRMKRLEKTLMIDPEAKAVLSQIGRKQIWLVITEGWCGDAAQNIPVIELAASASANIETRYILRDENLDLMDRFLTDGARSIPKLIAVDAASFEVLWTWGPRPKDAQSLFESSKAEGADKAAIMEDIQRWYNVDKGRETLSELAELARSEGGGASAVSAN